MGTHHSGGTRWLDAAGRAWKRRRDMSDEHVTSEQGCDAPLVKMPRVVLYSMSSPLAPIMVGMSAGWVVRLLGQPDETVRRDEIDIEYWHYDLRTEVYGLALRHGIVWEVTFHLKSR